MKLISRLMGVVTIFSLLFSLNAMAEDDVRIAIDEGIDMAQPIAVVPFQMLGNISEDVAQIISDDLRNSGKFTPLSRARMPANPTSAVEVNTEQWADIGLDNIVVGQVSATGNGYNIAYQLIDTLGTSSNTGNVILQGAFDVSKDKIRLGAHTVSDEIFEKLTQIKGAFRTKIAYVVQRGVASYQLRVADYDGHNAFTVINSREPLMSPTWSPNGIYLSYVTFENRKSQLVLHNLNSGKRKIIAAFKGHNGAPAFSPDGSKIAFASNKDGVLNIYIKSVFGGNALQLTHNMGNNTEPSWSPDGRSIVFTSDRSGIPQVYQMDTSGGSLSLIGESRSYNAKISSDGKYLIMISGDKIVKKDLSTGMTEVLSSTFLDESPSISPNGTMIIYSSTKGVSKVLQLVSADGRFKANLPGVGGQYKFPAWSPYLTK
ncbi:Tol-Pal system beta propeller repeat protein TolB [Pasteurella skyensis]|uniref:Tol-Pal system protein TolB n=1 Tax=Phocoenobacter skyensis TaxID=97481 RepID=A0AAJ6N7S7_9PAST|nr:Tol-Pal system beta propeller repeat protein TolB [Pasteurella skyensis]MDP8161622.1 Tol-Pal system beta propeller repeat protein TolB [Pasteurella skyensis]MDP8171778.1 Tol-Pal system beta propeller repeat protein TolB [Pasteurella skyensis]MDP8176016.1 Tol-Pal system beta propeller repeat protein TolB [Pasteurella skyensis]MDP8177984.1 Tol-Pal system beta propeller repeat protein TolB [Pasteurella skyensis]MDP8182357.1 Tol-Pal system beta propeller repeat protein TolB [Pasteurella skyensi